MARLAPRFQQSEVKQKPIITRSQTPFSRAFCQLRVFDWLTVLFEFVVIGWRCYLGFGFITLS